jgi:hypothetical protein
LSSARTVSSSRDFGVEQFFRADEFRAVDPSPTNLLKYNFVLCTRKAARYSNAIVGLKNFKFLTALFGQRDELQKSCAREQITIKIVKFIKQAKYCIDLQLCSTRL